MTKVDTVVSIPKKREKKRCCGICSWKGEGYRLVKSPVFPAIKIALIQNICLIESFYFIVGIKAKGHLHQYYYFTQMVRGLASRSLMLLSSMDALCFYYRPGKWASFLPSSQYDETFSYASIFLLLSSTFCHFWEGLISEKLDWVGQSSWTCSRRQGKS